MSIACEMDFCAQPATTTPQRFLMRLRRGKCSVRLTLVATRSRGMLMRTHRRAIDADVPADASAGIGLRLRVCQQAIPHPVTSPADEAIVARLPRSIAAGDVPPGCACTELPQQPLQNLAMVLPLPAPPTIRRQVRPDPCPEEIGEPLVTS